jgi:hypothetical protein
MIVELNLRFGGEFEVFVVIDISTALRKDDEPEEEELDPDQLSDPEVLQNLKNRFVPQEFHDMTAFFNRAKMEKIYPKVGQWQ